MLTFIDSCVNMSKSYSIVKIAICEIWCDYNNFLSNSYRSIQSFTQLLEKYFLAIFLQTIAEQLNWYLIESFYLNNLAHSSNKVFIYTNVNAKQVWITDLALFKMIKKKNISTILKVLSYWGIIIRPKKFVGFLSYMLWITIRDYSYTTSKILF